MVVSLFHGCTRELIETLLVVPEEYLCVIVVPNILVLGVSLLMLDERSVSLVSPSTALSGNITIREIDKRKISTSFLLSNSIILRNKNVQHEVIKKLKEPYYLANILINQLKDFAD